MSGTADSLKELFAGTSTIFLGTVLGSLLGLIGQVLLVRNLAPQTFGAIALGFTVVSVVSSLSAVGIPQGIARFLSAEQDKRIRLDFVLSGYLISISFGVIGASFVYLFRHRIAGLLNEPLLGYLLTFLSVYVLSSIILQACVASLRGLKSAKEVVLARNIGAKTTAIVLLGILLILDRPFEGMIVYQFTLHIVTIVFSIYFLTSRLNGAEQIFRLPSKTASKRLVSFSWPLAFEMGFVLMMNNMDILMIGYFLQSDNVGLYKAVQPLAEIVLFALTALVFIYMPIATQHFEANDYTGLSDLFRTATKWVSLFSFPFFLMFALFPREIILTLYQPSYVGASTALAVLSFGIFLRVLVGPNGATIKAIDQTKVDLVASVGGGVSNVILNILLIPRFGIVGAAAATASSYVVFNLVDLLVIYYTTGVHPFTKHTFKPLVITTGVVLVFFHFVPTDGFRLTQLSFAGMGIAAVHILSIVLTRSIQEEDAVILSAIEHRLSVNLSIFKRHLE